MGLQAVHSVLILWYYRKLKRVFIYHKMKRKGFGVAVIKKKKALLGLPLELEKWEFSCHVR